MTNTVTEKKNIKSVSGTLEQDTIHTVYTGIPA